MTYCNWLWDTPGIPCRQYTEKVLAEYYDLFYGPKHSFVLQYKTKTNKRIISFDQNTQYFLFVSHSLTPVKNSNTLNTPLSAGVFQTELRKKKESWVKSQLRAIVYCTHVTKRHTGLGDNNVGVFAACCLSGHSSQGFCLSQKDSHTERGGREQPMPDETQQALIVVELHTFSLQNRRVMEAGQLHSSTTLSFYHMAIRRIFQKRSSISV